MTIPRVALLVGGLVFVSDLGRATVQPHDIDMTCTLKHQSREVTSIKMLPEPIRKFVAHEVGAVAGRGDFFNVTDVIEKPAPMARFIRAGAVGARWFLWYERGGFAYSKNIAVFPTKAATPLRKSYYTENPCKLTDALLDQAV